MNIEEYKKELAEWKKNQIIEKDYIIKVVEKENDLNNKNQEVE